MNDEFDIAIVGMSCRLPGANDTRQFWKNLAEGVDSITRLTDQEILASGVPAAHLNSPSYVKAAPVLEAPGAFDAAFFGFTPSEARTIDPQQRILLELAYEALEDAGYDAQRYQGRIGVFTGSAMNTYFMNAGLNRRFSEDYIPTLIGSDKDFLSTRISYKLDLKGPSITVQTACSTSLVAVHLARQSLLSGETDMVLAGAISVRVPHRAGYFADAGGVTSPDGRVRAFDAKANGTVFGSGGGVIVMKRLADAIASGDSIRAVVKGSAVNNDGAEKAGYTAPSVSSQADAVVEALANSGISAEGISFVEAHGSGTPVGDPIEIAALTKAFRTSTSRSGYCAIGSVKTNIGHLDAAAGIAGVIKTVMALQHRELPPSLHFERANPEIDFPSTPFYVNTRLRAWSSDGPRRAGVMATGMGGTNAHVILEEAPVSAAVAGAAPPHLLVFSAKTEAALDRATDRFREFLLRDDCVNMSDVAYTLQVGRRALPHRRFLVGGSKDDAIEGLTGTSKRLHTFRADESRRPLVLLLPGVGDHYVGMGHDLYEHFEVFRNEVDRCSRILAPYVGTDIRNIIYPENRAWKSPAGRSGIDLRKMLAGRKADAENADEIALDQTIHTQPALFTVEYALARLWIDLGMVPDAIVGHSMGEYVAACLSGVLSLEDALQLIVRRAQLVERLPQGRMLAVTLPESELLPQLTPGLSISLINGPQLCVVAGPAEEIGAFEVMLSGKGVISRRVQNTRAFHSRMLDPIVKEFEDAVRKVRLGEPRIPFASNVTGTWVTREEAMDPAYWASHAIQTARFSDVLQTMWKFRDPVLVEAGPGKTLGVLAIQHPERVNGGTATIVSSMRHHYENHNDVDFLLHSVGSLWAAGMAIEWGNLQGRTTHRRVSLPTYPFERQDYWIGHGAAPVTGDTITGVSEGGHSGIDNWFYLPTWEQVPFPHEVGTDSLDGDTSWLIFADRWGGESGLQKELQKRGVPAQLVRFGEGYECGGDGTIQIDPASPDHYVRLFRDIKGRLRNSLNVIHLGCLTADGEPDDHRFPGGDQEFGFFSLLYIAQAIGEASMSHSIRIGAVSNRIHAVTGEETLDPGMATLLGATGVIPREYSNISCFNLDLPGPRLHDDLPDKVIDRILSEFAVRDQADVLAYRGNRRWKRKYERVRLPELPAVEAVSGPIARRLRDRGVYLVTGGTGGLGLAFARFLATTCKARIVLTRKTAFPDKSKWKEVLETRDAPEATIKILKKLLELERLGAEVEVYVADVCDKRQMRETVNKTLKRFHAINGVIHAAGILRAGLIQVKTKEVAQSVLAPKVKGTRVLFDSLSDVNLDFAVLFSSLSSVTAPFAHCDYSAANCHLEAFANYSKARGTCHTVAISWPVWKEVGVVAELEAELGAEGLKEDALENAMLTKDGLHAFTRILNSDLTNVVVSPENLDRVMERSRRGMQSLHSSSASAAQQVVAAIPSGRQSERAATSETEKAVAEIWKGVFGHDHIGIDEAFSNLGGHSLIAMQIVARAKVRFQIDLSIREFFAAATIAQLSSVVEAKVLQEIEALSDDEAERLARSLHADDMP